MALKFKNLKKGQSIWLIDEENQEPHIVKVKEKINLDTYKFIKQDNRSNFIVNNLRLLDDQQVIPGRGLLWIPDIEVPEIYNGSDPNWTTPGAEVRWNDKTYRIQDLLFLPEDYDQIFVFCYSKDDDGFVVKVDMQSRYSIKKTFNNPYTFSSNTESAFLVCDTLKIRDDLVTKYENNEKLIKKIEKTNQEYLKRIIELEG